MRDQLGRCGDTSPGDHHRLDRPPPHMKQAEKLGSWLRARSPGGGLPAFGLAWLESAMAPTMDLRL